MYEPDSLTLALTYVSLGLSFVASSYHERISRYYFVAAMGLTAVFYGLHLRGIAWNTEFYSLELVALVILVILALMSVANYARLELGESGDDKSESM